MKTRAQNLRMRKSAAAQRALAAGLPRSRNQNHKQSCQEVMGEEEIVMEEVVTGEVAGAETVPEPEGRQSEQQSRDRLSLEDGRRGDVRGGGVARQEMDRGGGCGSMSPDLLNGCWFASMCPIPLVWAIYHNQKVTDDRVRGEQASVGIARPPQRREPFPRRQRLRLLFWLPDPLR